MKRIFNYFSANTSAVPISIKLLSFILTFGFLMWCKTSYLYENLRENSHSMSVDDLQAIQKKP